jgi:hypothetical protein
MTTRDTLTKFLAGAGTLLAWLPIVAPLVLAVGAYVTRGRFLLDYLMPAELFPIALIGGGALLWAALRAQEYGAWIGRSLAVAIGLLFASQGLAEVTGLASGETAIGGWQWLLVLAMLAGYVLALAATGVGGILLLRDQLRRS